MDPVLFDRMLRGNHTEQALIFDGGTRKPDGTFDLAGEVKSWFGGDKGTALWHSRNTGGGAADRLSDLAKGLQSGAVQIADDGAMSFMKSTPQAVDGAIEIAGDATQLVGDDVTAKVNNAAASLIADAKAGGLGWILSPQGVGAGMPPSAQLGTALQAAVQEAAPVTSDLATALQSRVGDILAAPKPERLHVSAVAAEALGLDAGQAIMHTISTSGVDAQQMYDAFGLGIEDLQKVATETTQVAADAPQIGAAIEAAVANTGNVVAQAPQIAQVATQAVEHAAPLMDATSALATQVAGHAEQDAKMIDSIVAAFVANQKAMSSTITDLTKTVTKLAESKV